MLFAGSDRGRQTWAVIASLVETRKLNGVDPQDDLADVITRIAGGHPQNRLDEFLPWAKPAKGPALRSSIGWLAEGYPTIPGLKAAA